MDDREFQRLVSIVNRADHARSAMLSVIRELSRRRREALDKAKDALVMNEAARPKALVEIGALRALEEVGKLIEDYGSGSSTIDK